MFTIDETLTSVTTLGQSRPGGNGNNGELYTAKISKSGALLAANLNNLKINIFCNIRIILAKSETNKAEFIFIYKNYEKGEKLIFFQ